MEFQARISSECMHYLSMLEELYSKDTEGHLTRGAIVSRAFEEAKAIKNWLDVYEDKHSIPLNNLKYNQGHGTKIRIDISDSVNRGIRELKFELPKYLPTRSVTIGVTVRLICKAALLLNMTNQYGIEKAYSLEKDLFALEEDLKNIIAPINYDKLQNILVQFKKNIKSDVS